MTAIHWLAVGAIVYAICASVTVVWTIARKRDSKYQVRLRIHEAQLSRVRKALEIGADKE